MSYLNIKKEQFFYTSNLLSFLRIILAIPFVYLLSFNSKFHTILLVITSVIIILTDFLDGYLSRKYNQITELGKILDPIADKIIMATGLIGLIIYRDFPINLVLLLLVRDFFILLFGFIIVKKYMVPVSNWWGKFNTGFFSLLAFLYILNVKSYFLTILYLLSYFTTIISGITYYLSSERMFLKKKSHKIISRLSFTIITLLILNILLNQNFSSYPSNKNYIEDFKQKEELLNKYSPILYLHEKETYYPIDVNSFLENSTLMKKNFITPFDIKIGDNIKELLKQKKYQNENYYLKLNKNIFSSIKNKFNFIKDKYKKTIYANAFKTKNSEYILQYWFFYWASMLDSTKITLHECDWEMIMIVLNKDMKPILAGYSQHLYGEVKKWDKIEKEDSHPIVYVSKGSHSNYFSPGKKTIFLDRGKRLPFIKELCKKDIRLDFKEYILKPINSKTYWVRFKGNWGIPLLIKHNGPMYRNPILKRLSMWLSPTKWLNKFQTQN